MAAKIAVLGDRVYYSVSEEFINIQQTWEWRTLQEEDLLTGIAPGQTITAEISWVGNQIHFTANGIEDSYSIPPGTVVNPPMLDNSKLFRTRINLVTDTTPTFTWGPGGRGKSSQG